MAEPSYDRDLYPRLNIRLPRPMRNQVDREAAARGVSRAKIVREALRLYFGGDNA